MDNARFRETLESGCAALKITLPALLQEALLQHYALLVQWNRHINLTAVDSEAEAAEKHYVDSLALLPELGGQRSILDVGAGGGFPGLVVQLAQPAESMVMVDAVAKKVGFLKQAIAALRVPGARALHLRLEGTPEKEGLQPFQCVTARAVGPLGRLLPLLRPYLEPGGRFVAALGKVEPSEVEVQARALGWEVAGLRSYRLPGSGAERSVAVLHPR